MQSRVTALLVLILVVLGAGCAGVGTLDIVTPVELGEPSFFPSLEGNTRAPIVGGNRIQVLLNGDELFPALLEAIRSAQKSITFAQYVYETSDISEEIALALADRCRAGVSVDMLLDFAGSLAFPAGYSKILKDAGCRLEFFRPLHPWQLNRFNHRSHRRIVVVDGRVGFTGGFGVSEKWMGDGREADRWRDTHVRVQGPAVLYLQAAFAQNWREATGTVLIGDAYFPSLKPEGNVSAQVVGSSPVGGAYEAYMLFLLSIRSARSSIYLTNPYFVPDDQMAQALVEAAQRGVRVIALVPGRIDHTLVREASRRGFGRFFDAGIEIYEYQAALLHAKTMVIDGVMSTIGSTNLDNRSFALNEELNVTVYNREIGRRMAQIFESDLQRSRRVTREAWKNRGFKARVLELFTIPIRSQL
jgi:cardiolipin synthase